MLLAALMVCWELYNVSYGFKSTVISTNPTPGLLISNEPLIVISVARLDTSFSLTALKGCIHAVCMTSFYKLSRISRAFVLLGNMLESGPIQIMVPVFTCIDRTKDRFVMKRSIGM